MDSSIEQFWKNGVIMKSCGISILTSVELLFLIIAISMIGIGNGDWGMIVSLSIPTFLALYLIPRILETWNEKSIIIRQDLDVRKYWKHIVFLLGFGAIYMIAFANEFGSIHIIAILMIHYLIVSIGEEYIYRHLILNMLKEKYGEVISILISAVMFAFILHNSEAFIINLLVRLPLGIVFGIVTVKTKSIKTSIIMHTMYNLVIMVV